jgi:hypothetical protein
VRAELVPSPFLVISDEDGRGSLLLRVLGRARLVPVGVRLGLEQLSQARLVRLGQEAQAVACRPAGGGGAAAGDHHPRATRRERRRRDVDPPALVLHRLSLQEPLDEGEVRVGDPAPPSGVHAEALVFRIPVAHAERVGHPATAEVVQHADLLG